MKNHKNVIWGIILIVVGLIFGTNALGITSINIFFDGWWTLFIIVPCAVGLFTNRDKMGNLIGLLIGVALLLTCQDVFDSAIILKLTVPVIIIMLGVRLLFKGRSRKSVLLLEEAKKNGASPRRCFAAFSGQNVDYTNKVFEGAELSAVFGGIECDLRNAIFEKDTVITVSCIFGGADIFVPDNVNIKISSNSIFGGIDDKKHTNSMNNTVTLYINGTCIFGGVDIK